jgi:putative flippase GtrA
MKTNVFEKVAKTLRDRRSEIVYLFVGVLTTIVNFIVYVICADLMGIPYLIANAVAWVAAVLFAYVANRIFVFQSRNSNVVLEFLLFVVSRLFSLILESGVLLVLIELAQVDDIIAKIIAAVIVVVTNYITGKLIVFKRRD